jgi:antitoxin VapB
LPFHVRDTETDALVRKLAAKSGMGLTEAVKIAVAHELARLDAEIPLTERVARLRKRVLPHLTTPEQTDKEFFDELSGGV